MLLNRWSSVKAEERIADSLMYSRFCRLEFLPVPDHSTISRFKDLLWKGALDKVMEVLFKEAEKRGLCDLGIGR